MTTPKAPIPVPVPPPGTWLVTWNVLAGIDTVTSAIISVGIFPLVLDATPQTKQVYVAAVSAADAQQKANDALVASRWTPQGAPTSVVQVA
jgi:hypothetical protein